VLVELDGAEARADLESAEAALAESQSAFNRANDLAVQKIVSAAQLEQLDATRKSNQARVSAARARLADTVIRAPFAGRTGLRRVSVGSLINPGTVITTLDDTSTIRLDFTVPEAYLSAVHTGLTIGAATSAWPGRRFEGRVTSIDSRVDPATRAVTVRADLPNAEGLLKPGMFMTVRLQRAPELQVIVPEQALVPEQGKVYVFVVADGRVVRREIALGYRRPGEVQALRGLEGGERVIIEGTQKVREGDRVEESAPVTARDATAGA
jgi:membrane fusion protein (multidrug efflux system)